MSARNWLAIAVAVLAFPATAAAHAGITGVAPGAGGAVRVAFSAPVESAFLRADVPGAVAVRDPSDAQVVVVTGTGGSPFRLRGLSRDGHAFDGGPVGAAVHLDGPVSVAADVALFAGLLGLLGAVAFRFGVVAPAWRRGGPRPYGGGGDDDWRVAAAGALSGPLSRWWRLVAGFAAAAAMGLVLGPIGLLRDLGEGPGRVGTLLAHTRWGAAWVVEAAAVVVTAVAAAVLARSRGASRPDPPAWWAAVLGGPAAVALVAIAVAGHAASGTDAALSTGLDAVHMGATAVWLGGLAGLIAVTPPALRALGDADAVRLAAAIVVRFSAVAIVCVGVLVVTGVYRAIAELSAVGDLVHTGYGRALLVKLILFALLLLGGAYNRLVLHPRLERAALGLRPDDGGARARLRVSVSAELALAAVIIVVVAVLVSLPPP